jgi:glycosyltransferase involved in cell wall biosynthesis
VHFGDYFATCFTNAYVGKEQIIDVLYAIKKYEPKFIIYAGWTNTYLSIIRQVKQNHPAIKHIINWHSPLGQTEMSGMQDIDAFTRCNQLLVTNEIEYMFVPFQKDATLFQQSFHRNYRWFPDTMAPISATPKSLSCKAFKIGFFALPSSRKNILAQAAAIRLLHLALYQAGTHWAGVHLYVGNGFDKHKTYVDFLELLNIPYTTLPHFHNKQDYYDHLASMNLNTQVTFSEAFNYVCAESLALGVPCMGSTMTPALYATTQPIQAILERSLIVKNIDDPQELFNKMLAIATMNTEDYCVLSNFCREHIERITSLHNEQLGKIFTELETER